MILEGKNQHNILYKTFFGNGISGQSKVLSPQGKAFPGTALRAARQEHQLYQHDWGWQEHSAVSVIEQIAEILHVEPHCFLELREGTETFDKMGFIDEASALIAEKSREILMGLLEWAYNYSSESRFLAVL